MTSSVQKSLSKADKYLKSGNFAAAGIVYQQILSKYPKNKKAIQAYQRLRSGMTSQPSSRDEVPTEKLRELVNIYKMEKYEEVLLESEEIIKIYPRSTRVLNIIGAANLALKRYEIAIDTYRTALTISPKNAEVYNNLGNAFRRKGDPDAAIQNYQWALKFEPDYAEPYNNFGLALVDKKQFDAAIKCYRNSLKLKPGYAETYFNIGSALVEKGDYDSAIKNLQKALQIMPNHHNACNNMGAALRAKGELQAAIKSYDSAIKINPKNVDARYNKSLLLLNLESFKKGWPAYEYRWKKSKLDSVPTLSSRPKWHLGDQGRVLVWGEQGIGDEIMFSSLIPDLHAACSHLIVKADKRLIPILSRSFPKDIEFVENSVPVAEDDYDAHIAIGSLPLHFRPNIESFKTAAQGYLSADGKRAAALRDRLLSDGSEILIGLSWHSTSKIRVAQKRTISLGQLTRAFQAENVKFVSLQYGDMDDEINRVRQDHGIDVAQVGQIDNFHDIDGLAALVTACDRIVSIDNVTVHLAGALGKEMDALLPRVSNWRWGIHPNNSYWYNSVRLRRQTEREDWAEVLAQIS